MSASIVAIGVGDSYSQWLFEREEHPLVGDQLMCHVLLVPKSVAHLDLDARVTATLSTFDLLPNRRASGWLRLSADLPRDGF